jgi:hypothetical protein
MDFNALLRQQAEGDRDLRRVEPQIAATAKYLRSHSSFLDLISIEIVQKLIQIYGQLLDQEITSDTILINIKNLALEQLDKQKAWEIIAQKIWTSLISGLIQDMQRDLGSFILDSLDWEAFNEILFQYLLGDSSGQVSQKLSLLENLYAKIFAAKFIEDLNFTGQSIAALKRLLLFQSHTSNPTQKIIQSYSLVEDAIGTSEHLAAQLQADLWKSDTRSLAYLRYRSQNHQDSYYLEYQIGGSGDIDVFAWEIAAQLLYKFDINLVKIQFLLAANAAEQVRPWRTSFTLQVKEIAQQLTWRPGETAHAKSDMVVSSIYQLFCLFMKGIWMQEGEYSSTSSSIPSGRLWDLLIQPQGEVNWGTGKLDSSINTVITVRPSLWIEAFLDHYSPHAESALQQFSSIAINLLKLDGYQCELALRLIIHLMLDFRLRSCDVNPYEYQVESLLTAVLSEDIVQQAQESNEHARLLFIQWTQAMTLLSRLGWVPEEVSDRASDRADTTHPTIFYIKPYPKWLELGSTIKKPKGWINYWLAQKLALKPPVACLLSSFANFSV